ncbi:MAG TPA: 3-methyl-2-oxobutanoate hydroxymethyltransferase, partial [Burkholderiales bacterium]|nr:3-methyl-2-oxobutanoate hydroxymethyltransferase [Burkholderiales bacterium]
MRILALQAGIPDAPTRGVERARSCRNAGTRCQERNREVVDMRMTLSALHKMAAEGHRITMLTCYDASFAGLLEAAGCETLLV